MFYFHRYLLIGLTILTMVCTVQIAQGQIVNIESRRGNLSDTTGIFGRVAAGFNLVDNGSPVITFHGDAQLELLRAKTDWIMLFDYNLVRAGANSFLNNGFTHLRFNRFISDRLVWEAFGQVQYNEQIRILFRGLLGTGPRFRLLEGDSEAIYLGASYMYEYEQISDTSIIHRDHRLSTYLSFQVNILKTLTLAGTTYYQPLLKDFSSFRLSSKSSLDVNITKKLTFGVAFQITFDARLKEEVPSLPNRIYSLRNVIRYSF